MDDYKELRSSVDAVADGRAKISEVYYGDDGIDMAQDITDVLEERDRYLRALVTIADFSAADAEGGFLVGIARAALKGDAG